MFIPAKENENNNNPNLASTLFELLKNSLKIAETRVETENVLVAGYPLFLRKRFPGLVCNLDGVDT